MTITAAIYVCDYCGLCKRTALDPAARKLPRDWRRQHGREYCRACASFKDCAECGQRMRGSREICPECVARSNAERGWSGETPRLPTTARGKRRHARTMLADIALLAAEQSPVSYGRIADVRGCARGTISSELTRLVAEGRLVRVRYGYYALGGES